jgi:hypothetical protein
MEGRNLGKGKEEEGVGRSEGGQDFLTELIFIFYFQKINKFAFTPFDCNDLTTSLPSSPP